MTYLTSSRTDLTTRFVLLLFFYSICLTGLVIGGDESGTERKTVLVSRETNAIKFVRLLVQRLIYGVATMIGLGDAVEEVADGALVPPGVDDYGFGIGGSDNKDYDDDDDDDDDYRDDVGGGDSYDYLY